MNIAILGCGNWGSVFGIIQNKNGHQVKIWEFDRNRAEYVMRTRDNKPFLIGYKIPDSIKVDWRLENILKDSELIVLAIPCQTLRTVLKEVKKTKIKIKEFLSLIKGIEIKTLQLPSMLIQKEFPEIECSVLSGPSIANEVIRNEPTAVVIASRDLKKAERLQKELCAENFRIYLSNDIIGVELGGAVKNVLAIACGISDGLGFGANAKGALITRGIVEIQRLGTKMGADPKTFYGLSGLGDLITTSFSEESRNHRLGRLIGEGKRLKEIKKDFVMVAEGVPTARALMNLIKKYDIEMPISRAVFEIIYKNKSPLRELKKLMARPLRNE
uniref:Glycerol-3-phosphate dehydrogenase [NAD(P)+] n=1 Tax=candidate division WOR-3 bacterium TaxID=2052148 RepID=A0A7V3RFY4_UNCW3